MSKRNFLIYYYKIKEINLTLKNIKSKWKTTKLWPKNIAKPLISRLLLKNNNKIIKLTAI